MRQIRYLCLDDETKLVAKIITRLGKQFTELQIQSLPPAAFETQLVSIQNSHRQGKLDGLLVDLRLDEKAPPGQKPVRYTATGLAAQLRSWLSTRKQEVTGFPMILWSIEGRIAHAFDSDGSNQDLFDLVFFKESFPSEANRSAQEMIGLVTAYRRISSLLKKAKSFSDILCSPKSVEVDTRIGQQFGNALKSQPTHAYAQFILRDLINHPGPLINERTLCARLGLDFDSPDKPKLLMMLSKAAGYSGPFADAWPRWWLSAIDSWGLTLHPDKRALTRLAPSARIALIKKHTKLKRLEIAAAIGKGYSSYFSTVCEITNKPLDPIDGFAIAKTDLRPWQSKRFVSREVALDPAKHDFREKIDPLDADRLRTIREKMRSHVKKV